MCTVDLANDPISVDEEMLRHEAPRIDFLLPHVTWDVLLAQTDGIAAPYTPWLATICDW
jgi:uncharacterized protein